MEKRTPRKGKVAPEDERASRRAGGAEMGHMGEVLIKRDTHGLGLVGHR